MTRERQAIRMDDILIISGFLLLIFVICPILYFGLRLFLELLAMVLVGAILMALIFGFGSVFLIFCLILLPFVLVYRYFFDD